MESIDVAEGCTPVEIADTVKSALQDWYCNLDEAQRERGLMPATIDFEDLLRRFKSINKASIRASDGLTCC